MLTPLEILRREYQQVKVAIMEIAGMQGVADEERRLALEGIELTVHKVRLDEADEWASPVE